MVENLKSFSTLTLLPPILPFADKEDFASFCQTHSKSAGALYSLLLFLRMVGRNKQYCLVAIPIHSKVCFGNFEPTEVKPHKVCIVFIQTTCERLAKKVDIKNGQVYLRGLNPSCPPRRFSVHDIEIKGIFR